MEHLRIAWNGGHAGLSYFFSGPLEAFWLYFSPFSAYNVRNQSLFEISEQIDVVSEAGADIPAALPHIRHCGI